MEKERKLHATRQVHKQVHMYLHMYLPTLLVSISTRVPRAVLVRCRMDRVFLAIKSPRTIAFFFGFIISVFDPHHCITVEVTNWDVTPSCILTEGNKNKRGMPSTTSTTRQSPDPDPAPAIVPLPRIRNRLQPHYPRLVFCPRRVKLGISLDEVPSHPEVGTLPVDLGPVQHQASSITRGYISMRFFHRSQQPTNQPTNPDTSGHHTIPRLFDPRSFDFRRIRKLLSTSPRLSPSPPDPNLTSARLSLLELASSSIK